MQQDDTHAATRRLLDSVVQAQTLMAERSDAPALFDGLLQAMLDLTDSEYGYIGTVQHDPDGTIYLRTRAITDVSWNDETRASLYEENVPNALEFRKLGSLLGAVLVTQSPVIANEPATDPRSGGLPEGHPPLKAFLGVPLCTGNGEMLGSAGVANRPGGYDEDLVRFLDPLLLACANSIATMQAVEKREAAEAALLERETSLAQRTAELDEKLRVISQQRRTIEDLSTPILEVAHGVLTVPLVGAFDDDRIMQMTDRMLQAINDRGSRAVILDVTGVSLMDTSTAARLMNSVRAAKLLGCECFVSGLAPESAITLTKMRATFEGATMVRNLRTALAQAMSGN